MLKEITPELNFKETYLWTDLTLLALRQSVQALGFHEIIPAILSSHFEPGAKHSLAVLGNCAVPSFSTATVDNINTVEVYGKEHYYLPVSHVVEKQMSLAFLDKVYCLAPCLRLLMEDENSTGKHIYNFFQFEIEWKTESMDEVFSIGEQIMTNASNYLFSMLKNSAMINLSDAAKKNLASLCQPNFPKITFLEALKKLGKDATTTLDFTKEEDAELSNLFDRPFWIYDYPHGVRDSIYHQNKNGTYDTYDLMLPFGYGEITTGGIRPKTEEEIIKQSNALGKEYNSSYAQWKKNKKVQTAGFGIGLERFLRFVSGTKNILDFVQYHDQGPNQTIAPNFRKEKKLL